MGRPLKIAKAQAVLTLTATVASTKAVTVSTSLTTAGVIAGMPFVVATTVGGLVAGTTYYINSILSKSGIYSNSFNSFLKPKDFYYSIDIKSLSFNSPF